MLMNLSCTSSPSRRVIMFVPSATLCVFFYGVALLIFSPSGLSQESDILLQIKESLLGGGGTDLQLADWSNSSDFCKWQGVKCASHNVISLALPSRNLSGHLSSMIGKLSRLDELDLSGNRLSGHVPPELGNCTRLQQLHLSDNFFSGAIPSTLVNCSLLTLLDLSSNNISGFILPELGELSNLSEIRLYANNLSGEVPASLGQLSNLQVLRVGYNRFAGSLPPEIVNCTKLTSLGFASSNLNGIIPLEIGKLQRLEQLLLFDNQLTGFLPSSIGNCRALQKFAAYGNNIEGPIPREFGLLGRLQFFWVYENLLSGDIPAELGNMSMLQVIDLSFNNLVGIIPEEIGKLKSLSYVSLGTNKFSGMVPASFGNLPMLQILDMSDNQFSGEYPPGTCSGKQLRSLILLNNSLVGNISSLLKDCVSLTRVRLQNNHFTGHIPSDISRVSGLYFLELSFNNISGEIPAEVGQLKNLTNLILSGNHFTGSIPPQIGNLTNLGRLNLSDNKLSGNIPSQVKRLVNLENLDLSRNSLEGAIPQHLCSNFPYLLFFKISSNNLTGNIPASLGDCSNLIELDLSRNRFEKSIPREVGKLVHLSTGLDLSWNRLSGSLPPEIANLVLLESLDVSHNQLSGQIPPVLKDLVLLQKFNFSYNRFTGRIPALKGISDGAASAFDGNDALCGPPISNFCLGSRNSTPNDNSMGTGTVAGIVMAGLATVTLVILGLVYYRSKNQGQGEGEKEDLGDESFNQVKVESAGGYKHMITYQRILEATEEFNDKHLIGSGTFGRVYKVLLTEAENSLAIAAKVLILQEGWRNSLRREIDALTFVRHRNIVRFLGMVYGGSMNTDILLYQYIPKGSLREALKSQKMGWKIRWNIGLGVAQALKYLHHDCTPPIVHRDVKSANILLDDEYVAHVADFGLAKIIHPEGQTSKSSLYGGTHGYMAPGRLLYFHMDLCLDVFFSLYLSICGLFCWRMRVWSSVFHEARCVGVVLLELLTGREAVVDEEGGGESRSLAEWAANTRNKDDHYVLDFIDTEVVNDYEKWSDEIEKVIEVSLLCTRPSPTERPSMRKVVDLLSPPSPLVLEYLDST